MMKNSVAVVYLARKKDGPHAFRDFLRSYRAYPAGMPHSLVIVFKGYTQLEDLKSVKEEFSSLSYTALELPDEGFGLGSCLEIAKRLPHTYICWFNTWSKIIGNNWLEKFYSHLSSSKVGMVSATGSYEGIYESASLMQKVLWLNIRPELNLLQRSSLNKYFGALLHQSHLRFSPNWKDGINLLKLLGKKCLKSVYRSAVRSSTKELNISQLQELWNEKKEQQCIAQYKQFPRFPNPHLRPNGFMIRREHLIGKKKTLFLNKIEEIDFECGEEGLTRRLLQAGLKTKIVGANGVAYDIDEWPYSNTFRLGDQSNLLIADNQTEFFSSLRNEDRITYSWFTWGEQFCSLPKDFPDFLGLR
jgi:hypothetical protein